MRRDNNIYKLKPLTGFEIFHSESRKGGGSTVEERADAFVMSKNFKYHTGKLLDAISAQIRTDTLNAIDKAKKEKADNTNTPVINSYNLTDTELEQRIEDYSARVKEVNAEDISIGISEITRQEESKPAYVRIFNKIRRALDYRLK